MNFNIRIINLKNDIMQLVQKSELPAGVVYYILKDLYNEISDVYNQSIALEQSLSELEDDNNDNDKEEEN